MNRGPLHSLALLIAVAILIVAGWVALRVRTPYVTDAATEPTPTSQLVGPTMGGDWSVRFATPLDAPRANSLQAEIQSILDRIDGQMSTWKPDSDLSRFNASRGTDWFPVPAALAAVVAEAQRVSEGTSGAFDVTVGPLVILWGFGPSPNAAHSTPVTRPAADRVPPDAAIAVALAHVGYSKLDVRPEPPALRKSGPDVYVDLSGIAQGYAADRVAEHLTAAGVSGHLVDVCGEVHATGAGPRGEPWRVAVQAPVPDTLRPFRGVQLAKLALATSGDYVNFFDYAGERYSHEIDPRTGRPIRHRLASVSVAHPSAATADALATALMVLGPEAAPAHARRHGIAALFILRSESGPGFETITTSEFELLLPSPAPGANP